MMWLIPVKFLIIYNIGVLLKINIEPIIVGGSQEKNFRSGTLPSPMIVGFGMACKIAKENFESDQQRIKTLLFSFIQ